ncbi:DUF3558 domain-containing protein [Rhodococcus sp. IEGM 1374]|uniref:DUF3558 domain-containing protein n=1 Tax=Rhodococcus sp. IEGM 1374 TaxID=3082221 RepID=UPI002953FB31|nr:DUF3558 domain-containing protein [Rhodococcus sp. IEGM 1374]MDV7990193.1 DUF3558 domain-containing protein [Rhodococcus sp. IEGM 1374]
MNSTVSGTGRGGTASKNIGVLEEWTTAMHRARRWLPAMAILLLLTGCASATEDDATPTAASTTIAAPTEPWDPCTIPDEAIERAGLNAETKESGIFGRDQNGFKICGWENQPPNNMYYISLIVGMETLDFIDDPNYFDRLSPVRIGTRNATQYQQLASEASLNCGVAFTVGPQLIRATLLTDGQVRNPPYDPCTELNRVVADLASELPN